MGDGLQLFVPITKIDSARQEVIGVLAEEALDKSGEIMDYASSVPYFKAWSDACLKRSRGKSYGNVREMHDKTRVAGCLKGIAFNDEARQIEVRAKVVDPTAWAKCEEGAYTGFSVGGGYVRKWADPNTGGTRYTAGPAEASLVDNPCMYGATYHDLIKGADKSFPKHDAASPDAMIEPRLAKYIRKEGGKFIVYSEAGKKLGTHDERADAEAQLGAIEANKHGGGMSKALEVVGNVVDAMKKLHEIDGGADALPSLAKVLVKAAQQVAANDDNDTEDANAGLDEVLNKLNAALAAGGSAMDTDKIVTTVMEKLAPQIESAVNGALAKISEAGVASAQGVIDLRKSHDEQKAELQKRHDETQATLATLTKQGEEQAARLDKLEKSVVIDPKRPPVTALTKDAERGEQSKDITQEELAKMAPEDRAFALAKQSLGRPFVINRASVPER